jgi:AAA ATPase domain
VLPKPNFPVKPDEFVGRQAHIEAFREALRHSAITGRMASFAVLGDWGIGKSSLLLKLAATGSESNFRMLPVMLSISKDISGHMRFAEALCDRLANTLLASDSLATRIRAEIENWKVTKVSVGALTIDRQNRRYFLSSGSALLRHALIEAWEHFIRPAYAGAIFFLDDLHNLATPTVQDTALIIRDQFQSFGIVPHIHFKRLAEQPQELQQQHREGAGPQARHCADPQGGLLSLDPLPLWPFPFLSIPISW